MATRQARVKGKAKFNLATFNKSLHARFKGAVKLNELNDVIHICRRLPWDEKVIAEFSDYALDDGHSSYHRVWTEHDTQQLRLTYDKDSVEVPFAEAERCIKLLAYQHRFNPLQEWLIEMGKSWDNVPRLDTWLQRYLHATDPGIYLAEVGTRFMIGAALRGLKPGCKMDYMLVLEGSQGIGKSTVCEILGGHYFSRNLPLTDLGNDRHVVESIAGKLIVEIAELPISKRDQAELKEFLSRTSDRARMAYGRDTKDFPRSFAFIGTTNEDEYLKDLTGNRRYWAVNCGETIDLNGLAAIQPMLWAEAAYRAGTLEELPVMRVEEARVIAEQLQVSRMVVDEDLLLAVLDVFSIIQDKARYAQGNCLTLSDIKALVVERDPKLNYDTKRYAAVLIRLGFRQRRLKTLRGWQPPDRLPIV